MNYPFPAAVLFDWDNTLTDTTPVLYRAFCEMRKRYDLPECSMDEYRARTGLSLRETFPDLFGDRWEEAKQVYLDAYRAHHLEMLAPFDGAVELVAFLCEKTGGKVGVVSNKTGFILREEVERLGWNKYFSAVVGAGDADRDKPAPDPVFKALADMKIRCENNRPAVPVWFVGDGNADMLCAAAAGCLRVRVADENKDGADVLTVKNCAELLSVLYSGGEML